MKEPETSFSVKKVCFRFLLAAVLLLLVAIVDVVLGAYDETVHIKEASRMFRSEATALLLMTRSLTPNINHRYYLGLRNDPDFKKGINSPRLFRTQEYGTVVSRINPDKVSPQNSILFLGGSTTECNEVDEEYRFPTLAGHTLSAEMSGTYRGLNLGVRGNTSRDSTNLLLNHPIVDQAQIVVLMNNVNDRLLLASRGSYNVPLSLVAPTEWGAVLTSAKALLGNFLDYYSYRSNILFLLNTRLLKTNPWTGEKDQGVVYDDDAINFFDSRIERSIQEFRRSLRAFVSVARALEKKPILMTQVLGEKSIPQERYNDVVRSVALETRVPLIDLEAKLRGSAENIFVFDHIHLNNKGSRAVSRVIVDGLKEELNNLDTTQEAQVLISRP
jgi:hypothetical protein